MPRRPIVAGNWKMNTSRDEAMALAEGLATFIAPFDSVERVLCPPFVWLDAVGVKLKDSSIEMGAQDLYHEPKGAFTGEVSAAMLSELCHYVIVGHSERRQHFGETDASVSRKVRAALAAGMHPIVCVGETLAENEGGQTLAVVERQTRAALEAVEPNDELVIAYEPIWAIGTGRAATAAGANETIGQIRAFVRALWGDQAERTQIQYGGSVTPQNAAELFAQPEIDGALVGGASLRVADFTEIVAAASK